MNIKDWAYERVEQEFKPLAVGKYRLRIKNAEKAVSNNSGNDMLIITFEVSGSNQTLIHYIPFLSDRPQITNRMLTAFFDSFGIDGNFNLTSWIGKCGGCQTKMETYNGEDRAKIAYFLNKKQQESLPAWDYVDQTGFTEIADDDSLPF